MTQKKINTPDSSSNPSESRSIRLLKWIREHPAYWRIVCTPGEPDMNCETAGKLTAMLAQEGFYELIFVLLSVHREAEFMQSALKRLLLELMLDREDGQA